MFTVTEVRRRGWLEELSFFFALVEHVEDKKL